MRKALLAGLLGLATGGGLLVPHMASAYYNQSSCSGTGTPVPGTTGSVYVNGGNNELVCADGFAGTTAGAFDGGAVSAGTGTSQANRLCAGTISGGPTDITINTGPLPGVYVIADGDNSNTANLKGYGGLSSYESTGGNDGCTQGNSDDSSTNSGGYVGVDGVANAPVPLIVCGFTSGPTYDQTGRDGCSAP